MAQVHHATRAFAAKFGCTIVDAGTEYRLAREDGTLSEDRFASAGEISETLRRKGGFDEITWEKPRARAGARSGVMSISYHRRYSANLEGPGNNDELDITLREETRKVVGGVSMDNMDMKKLIEIAQANGVWKTTWTRSNPGLCRMHVANRLRGLLRNSDEPITVGTVNSRFGIERRPAKKTRRAKAQ